MMKVFKTMKEYDGKNELKNIKGEVEPLFAKGEYKQALSLLAALKESVDAFFDNVMVMADDEAVKQNRLSLLATLRALFYSVADISELK